MEMIPFECYVSLNPNSFPNPSTFPFPDTNVKLYLAPFPYHFRDLRCTVTLTHNLKVHVNAIMWRMVYRELRALTNDGGMNLNPLELNEVYEQLWNVGTLLRRDDVLQILDKNFRPWPKVTSCRGGAAVAEQFYNVHDRDKQVVVNPYLNPTLTLPRSCNLHPNPTPRMI